MHLGGRSTTTLTPIKPSDNDESLSDDDESLFLRFRLDVTSKQDNNITWDNIM